MSDIEDLLSEDERAQLDEPMREEFRLRMNEFFRSKFCRATDLFPPGTTRRQSYEILEKLDDEVTVLEIEAGIVRKN